MQKGLKKYFVNMDEYLCSLGLYRKMVARDASSLFRAVSEQLYYSQNYHQRIRQDCADFMRANRFNFEPFVEGSFEKYLERLEDPKVSCYSLRCLHISICLSQVRLEPKGKYYNAFIQEVGTHPSAVTVFIEELGEKHLVPLTDLKPVNPVPAWNIAAPTRKGDLDTDPRGQRHHRHRYFRKSRGSSGLKGAELLMPPPSYGGPAPSALPPRFQPAGHPRPPSPLSPGAMTYDPYAPPHHHHHHPSARPRYGASRSSTRFLNRHLIGPQLTYYHPGRRYYHDYESYAFRSRRSRRQLAAAMNKDGQFGFPPEVEEEEPSDLDATITFYQLDAADGVFPPLAGPTVAPPPSMGAPPPSTGSSYRVQRGSGPLPPAPPPGSNPICSSEEDQEDTSTVEDQAEYTEDYIYITQDQNYQTSGVYSAAEPSTNQDDQERGTADSPPRSEMNYSYTQQVVKPLVICSSPSSSSSSPSSPSSRVPATAHLPAATQTRSVAMAIPASSPWLVNELGEPVCTMVAPPPYSYDPNGSDLPRDCRVLQYYFNLGVQWYHQSCWQQQAYPATSPEASYSYQHYTPYLNQEPPLHAVTPLYPETRGLHQPPSYYPESTRAGDGQTDGHSGGPAPSGEGPSSSTSPAPPGTAPPLLYQDQTPLPSPSLLHLPYEAPPPATYLPSAPPHLTHHSSYCLPPSTHWGALQTGGHTQRVYCPAPNSAHVVGYITAPPPHYIPPPI
ncbi:putative bifunctional UDP-N-acetylglucosamine transferase and deubiquitinase ALG13 [Anarrhichthys ocellatus]|uniref:putative bifunctional UDP-N-acetylglucosamine transferase and deubiquitinase ALG13 n=1 Tax=Anarrhichthys ocellatus TaxID=433405 RepID=UPI0012EE93DB|nr:putative bifunctional UDP-N-acetylglucosamine transferase and deubiquitinase ALG13 [Anarrhichthys ocellatus]